MSRNRFTWAVGGLLATLAAGPSFPAAPVLAQEEARATDRGEIPGVVMNALKARFPEAEIRQWAREEEDGVVLYDIEFEQAGRKFEADIEEDGSYKNFEKEIALADLPEAVRQAFERRYPGATATEIMEGTEVSGEEERVAEYEIVFETTEGKRMELTLALDGEILEVEEDSGGPEGGGSGA